MSQKEHHCCNPFSLHKRKISPDCRKLTERIADQLTKLKGRKYAFGKQKICSACRKELRKQVQGQDESNVPSNSSNSYNENEIVRMDGTKTFDASAVAFGISPLKFSKISKRDS